MTELLTFFERGGVLAALVLFVVIIFRGLVIIKKHHEDVMLAKDAVILDLRAQLLDMRKQKDEWQGIGLRQSHTVGQAIGQAAAATRHQQDERTAG